MHSPHFHIQHTAAKEGFSSCLPEMHVRLPLEQWFLRNQRPLDARKSTSKMLFKRRDLDELNAPWGNQGKGYPAAHL